MLKVTNCINLGTGIVKIWQSHALSFFCDRAYSQHSHNARLSRNSLDKLVKILCGLIDAIDIGIKKKHCWMLFSTPYCICIDGCLSTSLIIYLFLGSRCILGFYHTPTGDDAPGVVPDGRSRNSWWIQIHEWIRKSHIQNGQRQQRAGLL